MIISKDEVFQSFVALKNEVEIYSIRKSMSLDLIEMVNTPQMNFFSYCEHNGIIHESTAPYAQQNKVAERKNMTLVDMINSMLCSSGLSNKLLGGMFYSSHATS